MGDTLESQNLDKQQDSQTLDLGELEYQNQAEIDSDLESGGQGVLEDAQEDAQDIRNEIERRGIESVIERKVEAISDLRELSINELFGLEEKYEGILFYAFTDFEDGERKVDFDKWQSSYRSPQEGDKFKINFYGNQEAYAKLGAADILPPSVRGITVLKGGDELQKRVSERRIGLKGRVDRDGSGFFDKKGYIPVYSGDIVVISGVKKVFDEKYRKGNDELDYKSYESDYGASDKQYLGALSPDVRRSKYHYGDSLDSEMKQKVNLDTGKERKLLKKAIKENPDMFNYMSKARERYALQTGIDIPESIMFGIMKRESSFKVDAQNPKSSAGGLFQFLNGSWNDFLVAPENQDIVNRLRSDPVWGKVDQKDWKFNPEAMIMAGYWYAAKNMAVLRKERLRYSFRNFQNSSLVKEQPGEDGQITLKPKDAWIVYLCHHDGLGGAKKMLRYKSEMQEKPTSKPNEVAGRIGFASWQMPPVEHWNFVVNNPGAGANVTASAQAYDATLRGVEATSEKGWGWS
ncbi:MAG: hypothetical protein ABII07_04580 [Patescibacteria group bacterium]|nr:hypothetical protein [Patescibacteria group bacterium]